MRPKAIVYFEWIMFGVLLLQFGVLLLNTLQSYLLGMHFAHAAIHVVGGDPTVLTTILIFLLVLFGTLTLLVSRRRSKIAMWILIALFALELPSFVQSIAHRLVFGSDLLFFYRSIVVLQIIGKGVALGLLFTPSARRWMNREDEKAA